MLNVVHLLIEKYHIQFVLTGSSARKLKRSDANMLGGRAFIFHLDPFSSFELKKFNLNHALEFGMLPKIYYPNPNKPKETLTHQEKVFYLQSYTRTFLKEEIQAEQLVRKLLPFRHFLEIAAQMNAKIIEYSKIARDIHVDEKTVADYFSILEDTLVGFFLRPYHRSIRKMQGQKPKFYLFDTGVKRALDRTLTVPLLPQTNAFGEAFEHFIILEFNKWIHEHQLDYQLSFFRTSDGKEEIDLILDVPGAAPVVVEIKSSEHVKDEVITKFSKYKKDFQNSEFYILSREKTSRVSQGIHILPWQSGIQKIFKKAAIL